MEFNGHGKYVKWVMCALSIATALITMALYTANGIAEAKIEAGKASIKVEAIEKQILYIREDLHEIKIDLKTLTKQK